MRFLNLGIGFCLALCSILPAHASTASVTPTTCMSSEFTSTGNNDWKTVTLVLTNHCQQEVDLQNARITFKTSSPFPSGTTFWCEPGARFETSYPDDSSFEILSTAQSDGNYLASLSLKFPVNDYTKTHLPVNQTFSIIYGVAADTHLPGTVCVH